MAPWNVMIVDDHPLIRRGLGQLLGLEPELQIVAEASSGFDALPLARKHQPDLILLDLNMKAMSGLDTLHALRAEHITASIVILTVSDSRSDMRALLNAGADGYLLKDTEPEQLVAQLKQAMKGGKAYSAQVKAFLADNAGKTALLETLTERERQILAEVARGHSNRQIADTLNISEATVKVHMKSLLKKLQVSSRTAATVLYLETPGPHP
ncbi:response regulator [Oceanimonas marisflavi]|uniref:response regulator n=1 Tax=Oceanimonas marisflavi TaxID=2059724 RepID=UPI000D2FF523|nr:response regulator [Oceanimonas marisflavi]